MFFNLIKSETEIDRKSNVYEKSRYIGTSSEFNNLWYLYCFVITYYLSIMNLTAYLMSKSEYILMLLSILVDNLSNIDKLLGC